MSGSPLMCAECGYRDEVRAMMWAVVETWGFGVWLFNTKREAQIFAGDMRNDDSSRYYLVRKVRT